MNPRRSAQLFALAAALTLSPLFARATPINLLAAGTYNAVNITVGNPSEAHTLTGTVTFNSSGFATSANLSFNDALFGDPVFSVIGSEGACCSPVDDFAFIGAAGNKGQLELLYSPILNASGDITLCVTGSGCNQASNLALYSPGFGPINLTGGEFDPVALINNSPVTPTPEPSSLLLLGTGLIATATLTAVLQGRFRRS